MYYKKKKKASKKLREKREEAELTQNDVAEQLHVSPQSISKWERGEALPSVEFLPKLAEIYNCKIDDFFNEKISVEVEIPQSEPIDKTFKELKKLYDDYRQGQEIVLDEKQNKAFEFIKKVSEFLTKQSVLSISMLQRRFQIGYARAGSIVDGFEFLELTFFDQGEIYKRIINQDKLVKFVEFLNKVI